VTVSMPRVYTSTYTADCCYRLLLLLIVAIVACATAM
jgi:hypothetical protein